MHVVQSVLEAQVAQLFEQASHVLASVAPVKKNPASHSVHLDLLAPHFKQLATVHLPKPRSKKKPGFAVLQPAIVASLHVPQPV